MKRNRYVRTRRFRNPMPTTGAVVLTNGRRSHRKRNGKARKATPFARLVAKLNGVALSNRKRGRKRNGVALSNRKRNYGAVRLLNGVALSNRKRNGVALSNRKRNGSYGAVQLLNGKKRYNRNGKYGAVQLLNRRRKRNSLKALSASGTLFAPVERLVSKIPFVGKLSAPYVGPVLFGMTGLAAIHFTIKHGYRYLPAMVKGYIAPVAYTTGGIALGLAIAALPVGDRKTKTVLGGSMMLIGAGIDLYRKRTGGGPALGYDEFGYDEFGADEFGADEFGYDEMGDGGLWQLGAMPDEFGYDEGLGDPEYASVLSEYADAELSDAYYSGPDLDAAEGEAALAGPGEWGRRFPRVRRHIRRKGQSRHAQKQGHRWGWLIRLVGPRKFQRIAAMPAAKRVAYIKNLRTYALSQLQQQQALPVASAVQADLQASLQGDYGALLYAGG